MPPPCCRLASHAPSTGCASACSPLIQAHFPMPPFCSPSPTLPPCPWAGEELPKPVNDRSPTDLQQTIPTGNIRLELFRQNYASGITHQLQGWCVCRVGGGQGRGRRAGGGLRLPPRGADAVQQAGWQGRQ